jgi:hypothetical protein
MTLIHRRDPTHNMALLSLLRTGRSAGRLDLGSGVGPDRKAGRDQHPDLIDAETVTQRLKSGKRRRE